MVCRLTKSLAEDYRMNLALTIVEEVADIEGSRPLDLPPLNDSIDVDSLEQLIGSLDRFATVQFTYCQYRITVTGDGTIFIDTSGTSTIPDLQ